MDYRRGSDCVGKFVMRLDSLITATSLRIYLFTTLKFMEMTEAELRWITTVITWATQFKYTKDVTGCQTKLLNSLASS